MPESKLEQARASGLNSIRHRYDSASAVPRRCLQPQFRLCAGRVAGILTRPCALQKHYRKMQELLYGRDSPLARQTSVDGLTSIRMQDLTDFMRKWQSKHVGWRLRTPPAPVTPWAFH